ncbi:MAG: glucose 1-dehydrogenase [Abditibacteriales bacterium]|nr:glucose 1-dehydrogenase [Abditibacteriales bacterium]MDW8365245.1 glucose 1-dehydrogenase [Abditibacteriales bacterium]
MSAAKPVALITGSGAGIGKACALRFAKEGYRVVIADVSSNDGQATREQIRASGGEVLFCQGNVANETDCQAFARAALDAWGRIDVLVANAGARVYGSLLDATEDDWEKILGVNLKGVAYSCKAVLPTMMQQKSGAIVIISSANALVGRADMPLYDATKAAVLSLTRSLAVAHGKDGIRVNAICPGFTITDFHIRRAAEQGISEQELRARAAGYGLLGRPAEPHQIASAVYFMASEDASHITGQYLIVDGGWSVQSGAG